MRVKSRKRFLHECFETPYARELLCSTIKIFRPVVRALGRARSLTDQYNIFEKKKEKKKRDIKNLQFHHCVTSEAKIFDRRRRWRSLLEKEVVEKEKEEVEEAHGFAFAWAYPFVHPSGGTNLALLQLHAERAGAVYRYIIHSRVYLHLV